MHTASEPNLLGMRQHVRSYDHKSADYFSERRGEMLRYVPASAACVLDVGCGRGGFGENLKSQRTARVIGIEQFPAAAAQARARLDEVIEGDAEYGMAQLPPTSVDCVVFNDVLEHLEDPWKALGAARRLLTADGVVVASIPNVRYMPVLKDLVLKGEWRYEDVGVLDRTHLRFFTHHSMRRLFVSCGYRIVEMNGINSITFPWKFGLLNRILLRALDDSRHPQFAIVAKPVVNTAAFDGAAP